jgi:hypothetical protein
MSLLAGLIQEKKVRSSETCSEVEEIHSIKQRISRTPCKISIAGLDDGESEISDHLSLDWCLG